MSTPPRSPGLADTDNELLAQQVGLGDIVNPLLHKALALWTARKGERPFPAREDITPRDMAPFLRYIALVRVLDGGREYQMRVVGDALVQVQGQSFQGLTLGEIDQKLPGYGSLLRPIYDQVVAKAEPLAFRGPISRSPAGRVFFHETMIFPLGRDAVDHVLVVGIQDFEFRDLQL